jgi:hypothetical protein
MFLRFFRPEDPQQKAMRQLTEARLHLLDVSAHQEYYEALRDALNRRIQRLEGYLSNPSIPKDNS